MLGGRKGPLGPVLSSGLSDAATSRLVYTQLVQGAVKPVPDSQEFEVLQLNEFSITSVRAGQTSR